MLDLPEWVGPTYYVCELVLQVVFAGIVLLRKARHSTAALAWILVIFALPALLGIVLYLLVGEVHFGARRIRRHAEIVERIRACSLPWLGHTAPEYLAQNYEPIAAMAEGVGGLPPRAGNELALMGNAAQVIDALARDIDAARSHCHLCFYVYLPDASGRRIAAALMRARERGVACRLLVDAVGSRPFLRSKLCRELRAAGVRVVAALPASLPRVAIARLDLRNHRKLAVIDGLVGYTGSQNVADADFAPKPRAAPWVDAMLRIAGPAVHDLQEIFIEDWYLDSDESLEELLGVEPPMVTDGVAVQILPTGPNFRNEAFKQLNQALFQIAREELILTTPYLVPDEAAISALCTAARRGVQTMIVVPRVNDSLLVGAASRSYYADLLEAGIEIHEFQKGLLHAKTMTVDRDVALVSTANFDRRSFGLNFEVSALVYDTDFASQLRFLQREYIEDSRRVDLARWRRRSWKLRLVHNAAGLLSPLL